MSVPCNPCSADQAPALAELLGDVQEGEQGLHAQQRAGLLLQHPNQECIGHLRLHRCTVSMHDQPSSQIRPPSTLHTCAHASSPPSPMPSTLRSLLY